jgi:hypothetical protein
MLAATARALATAYEPIAAAIFARWAATARLQEAEQEAVARTEREKFARTVAQVAAECDGHVLVMDGGPSSLGAREWILNMERKDS